MSRGYSSMDKKELERVLSDLVRRYKEFCGRGLSINMTRGRPSPAQLDLSDDLLNAGRDLLGVKAQDGVDCRNYGELEGIPECRALFAEVFGVETKNVIIGGVSSLSLMYDYFSQCCTHGTGGNEPWLLQSEPKFIAVVPGYDRHFAIAEHFGVKMVCVPMTPQGPDMDAVELLVKDPSVKGMFCVPKYSNPDGVTYSPECVERLASLKPAAKDFRVIWDEAYVLHDLFEESDELVNVFEAAERHGTADHFVAFASTSKVTFPGGGVAALAASDDNVREILSRMRVQIICNDKINQLRHAHFFRTKEDLKRQMKKHAALLRPKFETVLSVLRSELDGLEIASHTSPRGGYFISLDVRVGSAKRVGALCKEAGLLLTPIGATYPYGVDPTDTNIRIAPSCLSTEDLRTASELLCLCVKIAACERLLGREEAL